MNAKEHKKKPPTSFIMVIFITLIAVIITPVIIISQTSNIENNEHWTLIAFFPIYAMLSAYLAYRTYNERRGIAWILVMLVWMSFASVLCII